MTITPRHFRLAAFAGLGFIMLEAVLFWLLSGHFGVFPVMVFVALKGFAGFALLARHLREVLRSMALNPLRRGLNGIGSTGLSALGAFLIFLPGIATTLIGLALFAPSVRGGLVRLIRREKSRNPRENIVTLDADEWREVGKVKKRVRRKVPATANDISP